MRHLVDLHGGVVVAHSEGLDRGTRFTVTLPARQLSNVAVTPPIAYLPGPPALSGIRVLAVDDNADARELVRLVLQSAGAEVLTAESGAEAIELLAPFRPDVVIADIAMPEMDGYELLRRIAAVDGSRPAPPVIALTAYVSEQDSRRALAAGFARHLGKPVSHDVLIRMVAELVSDATTAAE